MVLLGRGGYSRNFSIAGGATRGAAGKEGIAVEIERNEVTITAATERFALPQELDESRVEARFDLGVLSLTLPKRPGDESPSGPFSLPHN